MARYKKNEEEAFGSDSFLDIVANMVGIMIVLVMIAGLRAKHSAKADAVADSPAMSEIERLEAEESQIQRDILLLAQQSRELDELAAAHKLERDALAVLAAQASQVLNERRQALDSTSQEEYDLRRAVALRRANLDKIAEDMKQALTTTPAKPTKIETYPTPISHTVYDKEAHFQLKNGRITYIPMEELLKSFELSLRQEAHKLADRPELSSTLMPIGGFRLRYLVERHDEPAQIYPSRGGAAAMVPGRPRIWFEFRLLPVSDNLGETMERALLPHSEFRDAIAELTPRKTTITLWTYPDSFAIYRTLKKELYAKGFAVAGRPLPEGELIGGSPDGSKSAAQ